MSRGNGLFVCLKLSVHQKMPVTGGYVERTHAAAGSHGQRGCISLTPLYDMYTGGDRTPVGWQYWAVSCRCESLSGGWVHHVGICGDMGALSRLCTPHPCTYRHWRSPKPTSLGVTLPASHEVPGGEATTSRVKRPF